MVVVGVTVAIDEMTGTGAASALGVFEDPRECFIPGSGLTADLGGSTVVLDSMLEKDIGSARGGFAVSTFLGG